MRESIRTKRMMRVVFGVLVIGGIAALYGIVRATKNPAPPFCYV